jgi:hypothetical protein
VGLHVLAMTARAVRLRQEIARPAVCPGDTITAEAWELRAHVEIRLSATLAAPAWVRVDLSACSECRRLARRLRLAVVRPT